MGWSECMINIKDKIQSFYCIFSKKKNFFALISQNLILHIPDYNRKSWLWASSRFQLRLFLQIQQSYQPFWFFVLIFFRYLKEIFTHFLLKIALIQKNCVQCSVLWIWTLFRGIRKMSLVSLSILTRLGKPRAISITLCYTDTRQTQLHYTQF